MANIKSAQKKNRQRIKNQAYNRHFKSAMRSLIKVVEVALGEKNKKAAVEALKKAAPFIDRCAQKGVIPRGRARRLISRLTLSVNA